MVCIFTYLIIHAYTTEQITLKLYKSNKKLNGIIKQ